MLFSEEFSDVSIVCEDGVTIPAHKCILAVCSPYFKSVFSGRWKENQTGKLKSTHSSAVIKGVLRMLYTGETCPALIKIRPLAFISVASEYDLEWLKDLAVRACVDSLDEGNLKDVWQAGRLYESVLLKGACIKFADENASSVLKNSSIVKLSTEDTNSWNEFTDAIGNSSASNINKRKRGRWAPSQLYLADSS